MKTPNPNGSKVAEVGTRWKHRVLTREIEAAWNRKIPSGTRWAVAWGVLASLVVDLTGDIPDALLHELDLIVDNKDFVRYLNASTVWGSPLMYETPRSYLAAQTVLNLFRKFPGRVDGLDPLAAATERFHIAETRCANANKRLRHYRDFDHNCSRPLPSRVHAHEIFHLARRKIQSWLGPVDTDEIFSSVRFGPGGCVGLKRPYTTPYYKFATQDYTVTNGAYWYSMRIHTRNDAWMRAISQDAGLCQWEYNASCVPLETKIRLHDSRVSIANYNNVTFVPKNAKTHRAIAIEPHLNVVLQLSVGDYLKGVLKRVGCDLKDQSRNQELARVGSIQQESKDPVTIDLEMASDTMCTEIVRELMPDDWFKLLSDLRSPVGKLNGDEIKWEKFSSMGNGFTFELESLLFLALSQSVSDYLGTTEWFNDTFGPAYKYAYVSVYGDDIVVPQEVSELLVAILKYCGFRVNETKSFTTGPFRESCGEDYYDGVPVRAFYFERQMSQVSDLIHMHNGLKLKSSGVIRLPLEGTLSLIRGLIPAVVTRHLVGPTPTFDDSYVWSDPDTCHQSALVRWDSNNQNWVVPVIRQTAETRRGIAIYRYLQFLYSNTDKHPGNLDIRFVNEDRDNSYTTRWDLKHKSSGGSSGDVVIAGGGTGKLSLSSEVCLTRRG